MSSLPHSQRQRGAVLVVGLIVLMLITLMVTAAFKFSTYNLKAVGNMQAHQEAIAAANRAIEQTIGSWNFTSPPSADQISIDIDNNGTFDYVVDIDAATCVKATPVRAASQGAGDALQTGDAKTLLPAGVAAATNFNVIWDLPVTATDSKGTSVRVRQGISLSLTKAQCTAACPPGVSLACQ